MLEPASSLQSLPERVTALAMAVGIEGKRGSEMVESVRPFARPARLSPRAAQRHSKLVRNLRLLVPAAATALLATYVLSASTPVIDAGFLKNFQQANVESASMRLDRPRYAGEDLAGLPFEVSARSAARDPDVPELVDLENPEALRSVGDGSAAETINVSAKSGLLNTEKKKIDLSQDVRLEHSFGGSPIIFNTEAAAVDLQNNTVTSTVGVTGKSAQGSVDADSVVVYQNEGRSVLEGNVKLRLNGSSNDDASAQGLR